MANNTLNNSLRQTMAWRAIGTLAVLTALGMTIPASPSYCADMLSTNIVSINLKSVIREDVPSTLFGFNIEWLTFQQGYFQNKKVNQDVIEWLKPFRGAMYRYPGGEKANWFDWELAIGAPEDRGLQTTENGQRDPALFGVQEFLDFVASVNGVPLIVANLTGDRKQSWSEVRVLESNRRLVDFANKRLPAANLGPEVQYPPCDSTRPCRVRWWELGNELDWKGARWPLEKIVDRARKVAIAMKTMDPSIRFVAFTRTAGFLPDGNKGITAREFNQSLARDMTGIADAFSTHIYYEGRSIPDVLNYVQQVVADVGAQSQGGKHVFITEHARWPNKPVIGDWKSTWAKSGNLSGAIASADFMLGIVPNPAVDVALWHQLGARGPWQLFYRSPKDGHLWPNVVYWALRVLRMGTLDDVLDSSSSSDSRIWPGYAIRAVAMRSKDQKRYSVMIVNRAGNQQSVRLRIPEWSSQVASAEHHYITSDSIDAANTDGDEQRVTMRRDSVAIRFDIKGEASIRLAPFSVSSFIIEPPNARSNANTGDTRSGS